MRARPYRGNVGGTKSYDGPGRLALARVDLDANENQAVSRRSAPRSLTHAHGALRLGNGGGGIRTLGGRCRPQRFSRATAVAAVLALDGGFSGFHERRGERFGARGCTGRV